MTGGLPAEARLTPRAAERVARESAAAAQSFDAAARSLALDWGLEALDGKQVQRWGEALGEALGGALVRARDAEVSAYRAGARPAPPPNAPRLLVLGVDAAGGGRAASRTRRRASGGGRTRC